MSAKMFENFSCFVTGTDTEIGKTLVSGAMLFALGQCGVKAAGMKPVAAGTVLRGESWHNDDVDFLQNVATAHFPAELTTPYLFHEAIAPHIAASNQGLSIDIELIARNYKKVAEQVDAVIVEGVGGFRVPLSDRLDTGHLAQRLGLPVVMVVGMRLGCISHALLTAEAISACGLRLVGWVANTVDRQMSSLPENVDAIRYRLDAPFLGLIPHLTQPSADVARTFLNLELLPAWPGAQ